MENNKKDIYKISIFPVNLENPTMITKLSTEESSKVMYCQAESNYTFIHFEPERLLVKCKTLKAVQEELDKNHFMRVHSKYLINVNYIKEVSEDRHHVKLINGKVLPIARRRRLIFG